MDYEESQDHTSDKEQCSDEEHCCDEEQSRDLAEQSTKKKERKKPSSKELLTSAKVVAEGLQNRDTVDKAKFAHAAEDLLDAASHYGKLEEKGYSKYLEKAEGMLHKYGGSGGSDAEAEAGGSETCNSKKDKSEKDKINKDKSEKEKDDDEEGGVGNYLKMAQGMFKK